MGLKILARLLGLGKEEPEADPALRDTIPSPEPLPPGETSDVRAVRVMTREQVKRAVYERLVEAGINTGMWPQVFLDWTVDLLMTAKNEYVQYGYFKKDTLVDFYAAFRQCKEKAEETGESVKMTYLTALAGWLQGRQFTRTIKGNPEPGWFVLNCPADDLDKAAPLVTAVREGVRGLERDDRVSLYEVFSGMETGF